MRHQTSVVSRSGCWVSSILGMNRPLPPLVLRHQEEQKSEDEARHRHQCHSGRRRHPLPLNHTFLSRQAVLRPTSILISRTHLQIGPLFSISTSPHEFGLLIVHNSRCRLEMVGWRICVGITARMLPLQRDSRQARRPGLGAQKRHGLVIRVGVACCEQGRAFWQMPWYMCI